MLKRQMVPMCCHKPILSILKNLIRSYNKFRPLPNVNTLHSNQEKDLPEFIYAASKPKSISRVYVMGVTTHGGLGLENLLRPKFNKRKRVYQFMHRPHLLDLPGDTRADDVSCGYGFTVFATKSLEGYTCFGTGLCNDSQIGHHQPRREGRPMTHLIKPTPISLPIQSKYKVKNVACGRAHTLLLTDDFGLWTVGNNAYGQCGRPIKQDEDYSANALYYNVPLFNDKTVQQIECGTDTSFVLCDGSVYSSGWSADGQTGLGSYDNQQEFQQIAAGDIKGENIVKVSSCGDTVFALNDKGEVFGWGNSEYRQLSDSHEQVSVPSALDLKIGKVVDVATSGAACFALNESGELYTWGFGILGRGPKNTYSDVPQQIPPTLLGRNMLNPNSKVVKIFCGIHMAAAVTNEGMLYTWGKNTGGALGLGHSNIQYFPIRVCVSGFVEKVSCGVDHAAIIVKTMAV